MSSSINNITERPPNGEPISAEYLRALTYAQFQSLRKDIEDGADSFVRVDSALVHAYPIDSKFKLYSQRIFLGIIKLTQAIWAKTPKAEREHILQFRRSIQFQATANQLHAVLGLRSKDFKRIYSGLHQLYHTEFKFDVLRGHSKQKEGVAFSRFIGQYVKLDNSSGIRWEFLSDVLPLIVEPEIWASIDLRVIRQITTRGAFSLYCNAARYISNPSRLTANRPLAEWVRLLNPSTSTAKRFSEDDGYKHFNHRILTPALEEIAAIEECPFTLEVLTDATPKRKVFGLQFKLNLKEYEVDSMPDASSIVPEMEATLLEWGVSEKSLPELLKSRPEEFIAAVFLSITEALESGVKVTSPAGAFVKALSEGYMPRFKGSSTNASRELENARKAQEARDLALLEEQRQSRFSRHQTKKAREYFSLQSETLQSLLKDQFFLGPDCDKATREEFEKHRTLEHAMVAMPFFSWLAKQPRVLDSYPSAQTIEQFEQLEQEGEIPHLDETFRP